MTGAPIRHGLLAWLAFGLAACATPPPVQGEAVDAAGEAAASRLAEPAVTADTASAQPAAEQPSPPNLEVKRAWDRVVVDAGHGGESDLGAVGRSGAREKDITLSIAREVSRALRSRGFEVIETRADDIFLGLERRTSVANASGAGLLLSIHANSAPSRSAQGIETYYMDLASDAAARRLAERENRSGGLAVGQVRGPQSGIEDLVSELRMGATAKQSRELAKTLHRSLLEAGAEFYGKRVVRDRGVRTAPFWVLVDSQIPAVLVEVGYLTHREEEQRLRTRGYHHVVGEALARAVAEFAERAGGLDAVPEGGPQ